MQKQSEHVTHVTERIRLTTSRIHGACGIRHPHLFAGDWEDGQREQAHRIIPLLKKVAVPCFYLMGNDDNVALDYEDEQIKPLHGRRLHCGTCGLVGYQYTPPFVGRVFVKSEEEITTDLQSLEPLQDEPTVLVSHAPAYGILDCSFGGAHTRTRS